MLKLITKIVVAGDFTCLRCMTKQRGKNTIFLKSPVIHNEDLRRRKNNIAFSPFKQCYETFLLHMLNGFLFSELFFICGWISLFIVSDDYMVIFPLLLLIGAIIQLITMYLGPQVVNRSHNILFAKRKNLGAVNHIKRGGVLRNVDGIRVNGKVYQIPDGVCVVVTKNGKVIVFSILMGLIFFWRSRVIRTTPPDNYWIPLFEAK